MGSISDSTLIPTANQPVQSRASVKTWPHFRWFTLPLRPITGTQKAIAPTVPVRMWAMTRV